MQNRTEENQHESIEQTQDVMLGVCEYLNPHDLSQLSACCSSLFHQATSIHPWTMHLLRVGMKQEHLWQIQQTPIAINWKMLYWHLKKLRRNWAEAITSPWQVLCLLGNVADLKKAISDHQSLPVVVDEYGRDLCFYAALSGHLDMLRYVLEQYNISEGLLTVKDKKQRTILHELAWNFLANTLEIIDYCINTLNMDPDRGDGIGQKMLHYALVEPNEALCRYIFEKYQQQIFFLGKSDDDLQCFINSHSRNKDKANELLREFKIIYAAQAAPQLAHK